MWVMMSRRTFGHASAGAEQCHHGGALAFAAIVAKDDTPSLGEAHDPARESGTAAVKSAQGIPEVESSFAVACASGHDRTPATG